MSQSIGSVAASRLCRINNRHKRGGLNRSILASTSAAALHDSRTVIERTETIRLDTLDRVVADLKGTILLKIDTQGYEKQVIEGGWQTLSRLKGILMELPIIHIYEGEWHFQEAVKFMAEAGFILAQIPLWAITARTMFH